MPRPLIVYNSDIAQSLTDAITYLAARGIATLDLIGISYGAANEILEVSNVTGEQVTTAKVNGVVTNTWNGQNTFTAFYISLPSLPSAFSQCDAIYFSTYTPFAFRRYDIADYTGPLPSRITDLFNGRLGAPYTRSNGRLGAPAYTAIASGNGSVSYTYAAELVNCYGARVFDAALRDGIAAERNNNFSALHLFTTDDTGPEFGYDSAYNTAQIAAAAALGVRNSAALGAQYPTANMIAGTTRPPPAVFGWCASNGSLDTNDATQITAQSCTPSYRAAPGGWQCQWFSYQYFGAFNFLYNGGTSAYTSAFEPFATGIVNPYFAAAKLLVGGQMDKILSGVYGAPQAYPSPATVMSLANQTVLGLPDYRPYKQSVFNGAAPFPF